MSYTVPSFEATATFLHLRTHACTLACLPLPPAAILTVLSAALSLPLLAAITCWRKAWPAFSANQPVIAGRTRTELKTTRREQRMAGRAVYPPDGTAPAFESTPLTEHHSRTVQGRLRRNYFLTTKSNSNPSPNHRPPRTVSILYPIC